MSREAFFITKTVFKIIRVLQSMQFLQQKFNGQTLRPVQLCNFLSNLSRNGIARQVAGELQCDMGVLAIFLLREALHEVELISTFRNGLQKLTTSLHRV